MLIAPCYSVGVAMETVSCTTGDMDIS